MAKKQYGAFQFWLHVTLFVVMGMAILGLIWTIGTCERNRVAPSDAA